MKIITNWFLLISGLILGVLITIGFFIIEHDMFLGRTGCDLIRPPKSCLDEIIPENCPEIDELCEEDFIRMCELSCYEICPDIIDVTKVCHDNCDCD